MDWTFWVGLVAIVAIVAVTYWAAGLRRRRDAMRGENREVADAVAEAEKAKHRDSPLGGGGLGGI
jgi:hypothetical protein